MGPSSHHFGPLLREKRTQAHKTLGDVARALGCSVSFVSDVEHGRRHPFDRRQILKLADLLQMPAEPFALAAAKDRQVVKIESNREDHLEMAASFARVLDSGDAKRIAELRAFFARSESDDDEKTDAG